MGRRYRTPVVILAVIAVGVSHAHSATSSQGAAQPSGRAASIAIAYANKQIGRPYRWGATGPDAFDCSGLVMMAYRSAGVSIARTTFEQWKTERHVTTPEPGDLAFFAGSDGTMTDPGHVGIVTGHGDMIEAPGTGEQVRVASWHRPDLVGFTDPAVKAGA